MKYIFYNTQYLFQWSGGIYLNTFIWEWCILSIESIHNWHTDYIWWVFYKRNQKNELYLTWKFISQSRFFELLYEAFSMFLSQRKYSSVSFIQNKYFNILNILIQYCTIFIASFVPFCYISSKRKFLRWSSNYLINTYLLIFVSWHMRVLDFLKSWLISTNT